MPSPPRSDKSGSGARLTAGPGQTRAPRSARPAFGKNDGPPSKAKGPTRVLFHMTCTECGAEDTLPFVPKGGNGVLCHVCAERRFGPDWSSGRAKPKKEMFSYHCAACGVTAESHRKPEPGELMLCGDCLSGVEKADPTRLEGLQQVDAQAGVRKIKRP
jgi:CxxC-x17-CxxC domain-containing protein